MKLLIKYPTRQRPDKFKKTFERYYSMLSKKHDVEFVVSADADDLSMNNQSMRQFLLREHVSVSFGESKNKIEAINADMGDRKFDVLLLASDDMIPQIHDYDNIIIENMTRFFPNLDGALHFNDGFKPNLNTLSIMGVNLYKHFGYIYHPDYVSLWCDNEYQDVVESMGKMVFINQVIIKHEWTNYTGKDPLHVKNESSYHTDRATFLRRKAAGFPNPR